MPGSYGPSTIERVGDIRNGILTETSILDYDEFGVAVQANLFTVHNRIVLLGLWCEIVTTLTGDGCLMGFNWTSSVPVITVQPISAVGTNITGFLRGRRISWVGTAYNTAAAVTYAAGISYHSPDAMILGVRPTAAGVISVSQIGVLTTTVNLSAGTAVFGCLWTPVDAGADVEALL